MPANSTRRLARLAMLTSLALLFQGSECDKESDFFALDGEDGTVTAPDVTPPVIDGFQPSGDGVFNIDNFMFQVRDATTPNGARVAGLDPTSLSVTNSIEVPVMLDGSMATAALTGVTDGMHAFSIGASDLDGNAATTTFSVTLDRTAPMVDFTSAPPSSAQTGDDTFTFAASGTVQDPHFFQGTYTFREPGTNDTCDPDDPLWPEGSDPGQVDWNTFTFDQAGAFEFEGVFINPLNPNDDPLTRTICGRYQATDTALGKTGQPNPNVFDQVWTFELTWNPPTPTAGNIMGTVTDGDGGAIEDATITVDGSTQVQTDAQGMYSVDVAPGSHVVDIAPPDGTTCEPRSETVSVSAGGKATVDFVCTADATGFSIMITTGWTHPVGSSTSIACGTFATDPAQPGASYMAELTGSGVVGDGRVQGSANSQGQGAFQSDISQVGDYRWEVTVDAGSDGMEQASASFSVTGAQNSCPVVQSSARFKRDVRSLLPEGLRVVGLRPVSFRYAAPHGNPVLPQIGLIAEEVLEVYPDAVVLDGEGRPFGIRYDVLVGLMLREAGRRLAEAWQDVLDASVGRP